MESPIRVIGLGVLVVSAAWVWLGHLRSSSILSWRQWSEDAGLVANSSCSGRSLSVPADDLDRMRTGRLLLRMMERQRRWETWRYVWGSLYRAKLLRSWRMWTVGIVIAILVSSYSRIWCISVLVIIVLLPNLAVDLPIHTSIFPGGGRRERYRATMVLLGAVWGLCIALVALVVLGSNLLAWGAPLVSVFGVTLSPSPVNPMYLWLGLAMPPFVALAKLLLHVNRCAWFVLTGAAIVLIFPVTFCLGPMIHTKHILAIAAALWTCLTLLVRHVALHGDIVGVRS